MKKKLLAITAAILATLGISLLPLLTSTANATQVTGMAYLAHSKPVPFKYLPAMFNKNGPKRYRQQMVNGKLTTITYYTVVFAHTGDHVLDVVNGGGSGAKVQLWNYNGNNQQFWASTYTNYGGGFTYTQWNNYNVPSVCLDLTNHGSDGTQFQVFTCNGDANQALSATYGQSRNFVFDEGSQDADDGGVPNGVIDNANNSVTNGNKIQIWDYLDDNSQGWCLPTVWPNGAGC